MSLFDTLFGQFIDVIHWVDDSGDTLVHRFERQGHEIKHGAKLTVREGQTAVFVHEGKLADVFPPGIYRLKTANLPILSVLQHWDHGFESPFKSEIYFVSTRRFTDLKWGLKNPVMIRDPEFGPVRLRAYGTYTARVSDPAVFMREIVGTDGLFTTGEISNQIRNVIVSRFSNAVATSRVPVLDMAANLDDLGGFVRTRIAPEMAELGLEIPQLFVENVSLPPEVEKALDRRTSMGVIGDLKRYAQFQAAEALRAAGEAPGGGAAGGIGAGFGAGVGMAMGRQMSDMFVGSVEGGAPPPLPSSAGAAWHVAIDGKTAGPLTLAEVTQLGVEGRLDAGTLMWRRGMAEWTPLSRVSDLQTVLPATPPPLPAPGG